MRATDDADQKSGGGLEEREAMVGAAPYRVFDHDVHVTEHQEALTLHVELKFLNQAVAPRPGYLPPPGCRRPVGRTRRVRKVMRDNGRALVPA